MCRIFSLALGSLKPGRCAGKNELKVRSSGSCGITTCGIQRVYTSHCVSYVLPAPSNLCTKNHHKNITLKPHFINQDHLRSAIFQCSEHHRWNSVYLHRHGRKNLRDRYLKTSISNTQTWLSTTRKTCTFLILWTNPFSVFFNSGVVISTVTWQQEGYGFEPVGQLWPFCVEFPCSPCATVQIHAG